MAITITSGGNRNPANAVFAGNTDLSVATTSPPSMRAHAKVQRDRSTSTRGCHDISTRDM